MENKQPKKEKKTRSKTQRWILNEEFIFGGKRCIRCSKVMSKKEKGLICEECKNKSFI